MTPVQNDRIERYRSLLWYSSAQKFSNELDEAISVQLNKKMFVVSFQIDLKTAVVHVHLELPSVNDTGIIIRRFDRFTQFKFYGGQFESEAISNGKCYFGDKFLDLGAVDVKSKVQGHSLQNALEKAFDTAEEIWTKIADEINSKDIKNGIQIGKINARN